jgi:peptidyl-prolyl cis-trans isomerase SurA
MRVFTILILLFVLHSGSYAQPVKLDEIVGVVGSEIVLKSDIQIQKNQIIMQGGIQDITDCEVLEEILFEKILLNQAKVDSLEVSDDMVNSELDKRLDMFVRQIGSVQALEEYYGKSVGEIREEFFDVLKDQLLVQRMESEVTAEMNITPSDVQAFYNSIPVDSLPFVSASVEFAMIAKYPKPNRDEIDRVRNRLREFKEKAEQGKDDFETLAVLYSEDPGSASKGGSLGLKPRGTWVPEFDATAFGLDDGQISPPFKTDYGWHIMQMKERRGEFYDANHILLIPKISSAELNESKLELDSIRVMMLRDSIPFAFAASKFSNDERTKNQNGLMVNPATGSTIFQMDQLEPSLFMAIDTLEVGQVSKSFFFQGFNREKGFRIVKLVNRTEPHRANLVDDYQSLQSMATEMLRGERMDQWMREKINITFVKVKDEYQTCPFKYPWLKSAE